MVDLALVGSQMLEFVVSGASVSLGVTVEATVIGDVTLTAPLLPTHAALTVTISSETEGMSSSKLINNDY